jgi:hypothetical protein
LTNANISRTKPEREKPEPFRRGTGRDIRQQSGNQWPATDLITSQNWSNLQYRARAWERERESERESPAREREREREREKSVRALLACIVTLSACARAVVRVESVGGLQVEVES